MVYVDRVNHLDEMTIDVEIDRGYFSGELQDLARIQKKSHERSPCALELRTTVTLSNRDRCHDSREGKTVVDRGGRCDMRYWDPRQR